MSKSKGKTRKGKAPAETATELDVTILGRPTAEQIGARLTKQQIAARLKRLGSPYSKFSVGAPHVTLSAQTPWVEDRGYLDIINPRTVHPVNPSMGFLAPPYGGSIDGHVDVWLLGLEVGASYFLQLRVGIGHATAVWTVSSSQGPTIQIKTTGGPNHTLPVLLPETDSSTELVILKAAGYDWQFFDVEVSMLT